MGSYTATCPITRQSIAGGDACFILPIIAQASSNPVQFSSGDKEYEESGVAEATFYPTAFWTPFASLIEATYSSCGEVQLVDTLLNRIRLLGYFRQAFLSEKVRPGRNPVHDIAVDFPQFIKEKASAVGDALEGKVKVSEIEFSVIEAAWDYLSEAIDRHRLFAEQAVGVKPCPVDTAIYHKGAVERLAKYAQEHEGTRRSKLSSAIAEAIVRKFEAARKEDAEEGGDAGAEEETFVAIAGYQIEKVGGYEGTGYPGEYSELYYIARRKLALDNLSAEALVEALAPILQFRNFMDGLDLMGVPLEPGIYSGDDEDNSRGRAYAAFVKTVNEAAKSGQGRRKREVSPK